MSATSLYLSNTILLSDFNAISHTRATSGYLLLYQGSDPPTKSGTGGTVVGNGHVAKNIDFDATTWTVTGLTATNDNVITGDANGTAEVTATHYAIWDDANNLMFVGALTSSVVLTAGAPFQIPAGAIDVTVGGAFTDDHGNDWLDYILIGTAFTQTATNLELELVSTAPTASAAGTALTGTGYVDLTVAATSAFWTVSDNQVVNAEDMDYGSAASDWTDPHGHNIYNAATGKRMYFLNYGSAQAVITGNLPLWRAGDLSVTIN